MRFLIDTNVAIAANGNSDAGPACVIATIERLERLRAGELLVLDDSFHILNEYDRHLNHRGQPRVGDAFYQWALRNMHNPRHCEQVTLAKAADGSFAAFPQTEELLKFDPSDRKFVAAALAHPARPPIVNACDKDWHEHREALGRHGINLEFLCEEEMTRPRR